MKKNTIKPEIVVNLIIKLNQNPMPNDCPLCGLETNPNIGAELFLADTENVVCLDCGMKHAPALTILLSFADYSRLFNETGEPLGKRLETYFCLSKHFCEAEDSFGDHWMEKQNFKSGSMNAYQNI